MQKKYIPIIALLSVTLFGHDAFSQKSKKNQTKRGAANRLAAKRNAQKITSKTTTEPISTEIKTEEINPVDTQSIQAEIERLTDENTLLRNSINEKQTTFNEINSEIDDLNEAIANLEFKQNKSKNICTQLSLKKMDDIKGWLIATVASSGIGTAANATATITTFMQKDPSKVKKSDKKEEEKIEDEKKTEDDITENNDEVINEEIKNDFEIQEEIQKLDLEEFTKPEPLETNLSKKDLEIKPLTAQAEEQTTPANHTIGRYPTDTNKEKTIIPEQPKSDKVNHTIGKYPEINEAIAFEKKLLAEQDDTVDPLKHLNTDTKTNTKTTSTVTSKTTTTATAKTSSETKSEEKALLTMMKDNPKKVEDLCTDANGNYRYGIRYENGVEISCLGGPLSKSEKQQLDFMNNLFKDDYQTTSQETTSSPATSSKKEKKEKEKKEKKPSKWQLKKQEKQEKETQKKAQETKDRCNTLKQLKKDPKYNTKEWLEFSYEYEYLGCDNLSYNTLPMQKETMWTSYRKLFVFAAESLEDKQEKKNQTLSTVSNISSIVGTVASGATIITAGVATSLIGAIEKQVKSCKDTF